MAYDGPVSRLLNRRISRPLARLAARRGLRPNQVTLISLGVSAAAPLLFIANQPRLGALAIQAASIADGVDGDLARLTGQSTQYGAILDAVTDRYADVMILAGMTYWAAKHGRSRTAPLLGLGALVGSLMVSYSRARVEAETGQVLEPSARGYASRDVRLLLAAAGALTRRIPAVLFILAVLTNGSVIWRLSRLRR